MKFGIATFITLDAISDKVAQPQLVRPYRGTYG
jgi:hypothetical protein